MHERHLHCILVAAIAGGLSCSSGSTCTLIGCASTDTISFELAPASGADLPPGTYVVSVTTDKESSTLSCTVPPTVADVCNGTTGSVQGVYYSQGSPCPDGKACIRVSISSHPATLDIVVSRDGRELTRRSLITSYPRTYPNGPDCGPVCVTGTVEPSTIEL